MKTIILTGGGTAGHIMPNIALIPELKKHFTKIYYLGAKESMEEKIISKYSDITFVPIKTTKLIRKFTLKNLAIPFKLLSAVLSTKKIIKKIKPDVIFCKGGFVSVPVAMAGKMCNVPIISHESDLSMGLANKIILKFAKAMCTSFETTLSDCKKCVYTGSPIRQEIFNGNPQNAINEFIGYNSQKPTILIFGGSQGSKKINLLTYEVVHKLVENYNVVHIAGKNNLTNIKLNGYLQKEFVDNLEDFLALCTIAVTRGGANSLFELLALNKPMLIIPLCKAQSRGDQIENAEYFKRKKFAEVLREENISAKTFLTKIEQTLKNRQQYIKNMQAEKLKNPTLQIVDIILKNTKN